MAAAVILVTTRVTVSFTMSLRKMRRDCTGEVKVNSRVVGEEESHSAGTGSEPFSQQWNFVSLFDLVLFWDLLLSVHSDPRHASVTLIGGSTAL